MVARKPAGRQKVQNTKKPGRGQGKKLREPERRVGRGELGGKGEGVRGGGKGSAVGGRRVGRGRTESVPLQFHVRCKKVEKGRFGGFLNGTKGR